MKTGQKEISTGRQCGATKGTELGFHSGLGPAVPYVIRTTLCFVRTVDRPQPRRAPAVTASRRQPHDAEQGRQEDERFERRYVKRESDLRYGTRFPVTFAEANGRSRVAGTKIATVGGAWGGCGGQCGTCGTRERPNCPGYICMHVCIAYVLHMYCICIALVRVVHG
jgi:hypothetical protein